MDLDRESNQVFGGCWLCCNWEGCAPELVGRNGFILEIMSIINNIIESILGRREVSDTSLEWSPFFSSLSLWFLVDSSAWFPIHPPISSYQNPLDGWSFLIHISPFSKWIKVSLSRLNTLPHTYTIRVILYQINARERLRLKSEIGFRVKRFMLRRASHFTDAENSYGRTFHWDEEILRSKRR